MNRDCPKPGSWRRWGSLTLWICPVDERLEIPGHREWSYRISQQIIKGASGPSRLLWDVHTRSWLGRAQAARYARPRGWEALLLAAWSCALPTFPSQVRGAHTSCSDSEAPSISLPRSEVQQTFHVTFLLSFQGLLLSPPVLISF